MRVLKELKNGYVIIEIEQNRELYGEEAIQLLKDQRGAIAEYLAHMDKTIASVELEA